MSLFNDPEFMNFVSKNAIALRNSLGSLSRYEDCEKSTIETKTNTCVINNSMGKYYHIHLPQLQENVLVYFGENLFEIGQEPRRLVVLDGDDHQNSLIKLVERGLYKPSLGIINNRINSLKEIKDNALRQREHNFLDEIEDLNELIDEMEKTRNYFNEVLNERKRAEYVINHTPELIEFMVYPTMPDVICHELISKLSWNKSIRNYNDTKKFIDDFYMADEKVREEMVWDVKSNMYFSNQQNNDVNLFLYDNYKSFCENQGINFRLV